MSLQNIFPISQPLKEYIGNRIGSVSAHIPEVASPIQGSLPIQGWDIAYSTQNDSTGILPSITWRILKNPDTIPYKVKWQKFHTQMNSEQIAQLEFLTSQSIFANSATANTNAIKKAAMTEMFGAVIRQLGTQYITRSEKDVNLAITNSIRYTVANTNGSITTPIPSWVANSGGQFIGAMADGSSYLNKILAGQLLDFGADQNPQVSSDYDLLIIIPKNVWNAFAGVWTVAFTNFVTLMGNVLPDARSLKADMFTAICGFSGAKVIIAESFENLSLSNELDTSSDDFVDLWQGNSVYMVPVSKNLMRPAGIIKPTLKPVEMFQTKILDTDMIMTEAAYTYESTAPKAFYKIDLVLS